MNNLVAIVGRPNVGKSSLFNMIVGHREAIVHSTSGVTRDRLYHAASWAGKKFQVIDTGGIEIANQPFQDQIKLQSSIAIAEATVIIFVVDGIVGLTTDDELITELLRKANKQVLVAANKLEGHKDFNDQIYATGFKHIFPISAIHGDGLGDLLDQILTFLSSEKQLEQDTTRLAIIGRPNVGKSSLFNMLVGKPRVIVSPVPGTTRDAINAEFVIGSQQFLIVDTAGIKRKSKLAESVEHYALARARHAIQEADIALLLLDSERELAHFDAVVAGYIHQKLRPLIIVVNKWDLACKQTMTMRQRELKLRDKFKFLSWAPVVFISAKTGLRINKLQVKIMEVNENRSKMITTHVLNEVVNEIQIVQPAPSCKGGRLNIKFVRQTKNDIPKFLLWVNNRKYLHFSYLRFLENRLREHFGFEGTPIKLIFKDARKTSYDR